MNYCNRSGWMFIGLAILAAINNHVQLILFSVLISTICWCSYEIILAIQSLKGEG